MPACLLSRLPLPPPHLTRDPQGREAESLSWANSPVFCPPGGSQRAWKGSPSCLQEKVGLRLHHPPPAKPPPPSMPVALGLPLEAVMSHVETWKPRLPAWALARGDWGGACWVGLLGHVCSGEAGTSGWFGSQGIWERGGNLKEGQKDEEETPSNKQSRGRRNKDVTALLGQPCPGQRTRLSTERKLRIN